MKNKIIGLGKVGCGIATEFEEYPEYRVYKIGTDLESRGNFHTHLVIEKQESIQDYEEKFDSIDAEAYLETIKPTDEVLFVVEGGDPVSGVILSLLEKIKNTRISILYVCPDPDVSSLVQMRDSKIVFNILQEYARSGLFKRMYIFNRTKVEELIGDVSIAEYEKSVYHFIAYMIAMTKYFDNSGSVLESRNEPVNIARISTFGVTSLDKRAEIRFLYPIEEEKNAHFYFGIPDEMLATDNELMRKIKTQMKNFSKEGVDTGFSVHATDLERTIVLCSFHASKIQN
jgi:hypothetical protein|tara:strand:+ start:2024 stop:2881 length:858 start_codon:yes stop_codon:yes gene_type:complete